LQHEGLWKSPRALRNTEVATGKQVEVPGGLHRGFAGKMKTGRLSADFADLEEAIQKPGELSEPEVPVTDDW